MTVTVTTYLLYLLWNGMTIPCFRFECNLRCNNTLPAQRILLKMVTRLVAFPLFLEWHTVHMRFSDIGVMRRRGIGMNEDENTTDTI